MCEIPKTRIKLAVQGLFHVLRPCPKTLPGRPRPKRRTDTTGTDWSCFSRCCTHFGDNMPLRIFRLPFPSYQLHGHTTASVASLLREERVGGPAGAGRRRHHPPVGEEGPVAEVEGAAQEGGRHFTVSFFGREEIRMTLDSSLKSCLG